MMHKSVIYSCNSTSFDTCILIQVYTAFTVQHCEEPQRSLMTAQAFRNKWHNARRDVFAYIDTQPHFCCWMRTKACVKTYQTQMNENPASLWYTRSSTLVNTITVSRLIRFRESVRFSELAQIHRACSQNWTVSCNQISISINILLNTEYSCICCNHTVLVTVKWLTNALRNWIGSNEQFFRESNISKHKGIGWTQPVLCCGCIKWGMVSQETQVTYWWLLLK